MRRLIHGLQQLQTVYSSSRPGVFPQQCGLSESDPPLKEAATKTAMKMARIKAKAMLSRFVLPRKQLPGGAWAEKIYGGQMEHEANSLSSRIESQTCCGGPCKAGIDIARGITAADNRASCQEYECCRHHILSSNGLQWQHKNFCNCIYTLGHPMGVQNAALKACYTVLFTLLGTSWDG